MGSSRPDETDDESALQAQAQTLRRPVGRRTEGVTLPISNVWQPDAAIESLKSSTCNRARGRSTRPVFEQACDRFPIRFDGLSNYSQAAANEGVFEIVDVEDERPTASYERGGPKRENPLLARDNQICRANSAAEGSNGGRKAQGRAGSRQEGDFALTSRWSPHGFSKCHQLGIPAILEEVGEHERTSKGVDRAVVRDDRDLRSFHVPSSGGIAGTTFDVAKPATHEPRCCCACLRIQGSSNLDPRGEASVVNNYRPVRANDSSVLAEEVVGVPAEAAQVERPPRPVAGGTVERWAPIRTGPRGWEGHVARLPRSRPNLMPQNTPLDVMSLDIDDSPSAPGARIRGFRRAAE